MKALADLLALIGVGACFAAQGYTLAFAAYALVPALAYVLRQRRLRAQARPTPTPAPPRTSFVLLVPAHNEAESLPRLLASIGRQAYPATRFRTVVVADNCHDQTAALARQAGALCLERRSTGPSSKSQALAFAAQALAGHPALTGAVVCILDADAWLDAHFLRELNEHFGCPGAAPVVQCARRVGNAGLSDVTLLDAAAEALRTRVGAATRRLMGLDSFIFGLGCCLQATEFMALLAQPSASLAEDKEWKAKLLQRRVRVAYCPAARLSYAAVSSGPAFQRQRRRWLAGQWAAARTHGLRQLAQGLRRGSLSQLDFACDLLQPPRSLLLAAALAFGLLGLATNARLLLLGGWAWLGVAAALLAYGLLGLRLVGAGPRHLPALLAGGHLAAGVIKTTLRLPFGRRVRQWEPTR